MELDSTAVLVSLAEAKEYLKIQTDSEDQIVQTLLNDVSRWVQTYVGRELVLTPKTEYYDGSSCETLLLRRFPIFIDEDNPFEIYSDTLRVFPANTLVPNDNLIIDRASSLIREHNITGSFPWGKANIKVVYTAGYSPSLPESEGGMPHDVRLAVKRLLDLHYRSGYSQRKLDVKSESVGDVNTTFSGGEIPKDVAQMLAPYRMLTHAPNFVYAD